MPKKDKFIYVNYSVLHESCCVEQNNNKQVIKNGVDNMLQMKGTESKKQNSNIKLPKSAQKIFEYLKEVKQAKPKDLAEPLGMPSRTVRHALRKLVEAGLAVKIPDLYDLRSSYYRIKQ